MLKRSPDQYLKVVTLLLDRGDLSANTKLLFLALLTGFNNGATTLPCKETTKRLNLPANEAQNALYELQRANLISYSKVTGIIAINPVHQIFSTKETRSTLKEFISRKSNLSTVDNYQKIWRTQYLKVFGEAPKRDPQELVRFRSLSKKLGPSTADAIVAFIAQNRNLKAKCTTLGLYLKHFPKAV